MSTALRRRCLACYRAGQLLRLRRDRTPALLAPGRARTPKPGLSGCVSCVSCSAGPRQATAAGLSASGRIRSRLTQEAAQGGTGCAAGWKARAAHRAAFSATRARPEASAGGRAACAARAPHPPTPGPLSGRCRGAPAIPTMVLAHRALRVRGLVTRCCRASLRTQRARSVQPAPRKGEACLVEGCHRVWAAAGVKGGLARMQVSASVCCLPPLAGKGSACSTAWQRTADVRCPTLSTGRCASRMLPVVLRCRLGSSERGSAPVWHHRMQVLLP